MPLKFSSQKDWNREADYANFANKTKQQHS